MRVRFPARRGWLVATTLALAIASLPVNDKAQAAPGHPAKGIVLAVDADHRLVTISCEAIPDYMAAMEMPFSVRNADALKPLKPGTAVSFTIVEHGKRLFAEDMQTRIAANLESEPLEAGQLAALRKAVHPAAAVRQIAVGEHAPDFTLTDQAGRQVELSQFAGKVVLLTFGYSRCPNPNYCYRLSNNLARVGRRLHDHTGRDLVLITIAIDPAHDQGAGLAEYANSFKADPASWHFLTGPLPEIQRVAGSFGMNFWTDEAFITHSLHTVILDRKGRLAVNLEGNQFRAEELTDLVRTVLNRN